MKLKFAGLLRGLLRQNDDCEPVRPVAAPTPPPASATTPPVAALSGETEPSTSTDAQSAAGTNPDDIAIPLAPIISHLPMDLRAKLMSSPQPGQKISLSAETVVSQLAFGAVKITFGELRQLAPGLFANSSGEHDSRPVSLPLPEILSRLNPTLLSRRSTQKVEVTDEIVGPFGGRGRGVSFTTQPLKPSAATPPATDSNRPIPFTVPSHPTPPAHPPIKPRVTQPVPPPETETFSFKPRQTAPSSAPIPFNPPSKPATNPATNGDHGNGNGKALPPFKFSTTTPVPPAASAPAPRPAMPAAPLFISLDDLAENWPEELKNEILRSSLANASVPLPMSVVEPGMKCGRVTMTWKELRILAKPSSQPSPNDSLELDLPLKVLAPAFLAAQKRLSKPQPRVGVSEEIPNLFFGFPQSAPTPPPSAPMPATTAPKPGDTNFYVWGDEGELPVTDERTLDRPKQPSTDFMSRQTHPREVVSRAMTMAGVAGAVVALADGLRVASEVPAEMNAEAVAAFLPQIFERIHQTTRELRMGALNNVCFTVGNAPWKIFRVQSVYFAAFGRAGEALPTSQLAALATELDRKK